MSEYIQFKEWLDSNSIDKPSDIVGYLKRANQIYNNNTKEMIDFSNERGEFLKLNRNSQIPNEIRNELDELLESESEDLTSAVKMRFDILTAVTLYCNYILEYCNDNDIVSQNWDEFYDDENRVSGAINKIFYGAPGTGKSYKVDNQYGDFDRVTFHPEFTYFDFVGGLRPVQDDITKSISYEFVPGPFVDMLIKAVENKSSHYGIIIEEINRANTAGVFGDLFQLLDRDDEGKSRYIIKNKDICNYIEKATKKKCEYIYIPSNMSIIATMNSADQGVFVMDSAFKRRWQFEYVPIDFEELDLSSVKIAGFGMKWKDFGKTLNEYLSSIGIEEDKLIGQRFISINDLRDEKLVAAKLLIYLWDDVLRYSRFKLFKEDKIFSNLVKQYTQNNQGIDIFVDDLKMKLESFQSQVDDDLKLHSNSDQEGI